MLSEQVMNDNLFFFLNLRKDKQVACTFFEFFCQEIGEIKQGRGERKGARIWVFWSVSQKSDINLQNQKYRPIL